jgi:hypothetical protein
VRKIVTDKTHDVLRLFRFTLIIDKTSEILDCRRQIKFQLISKRLWSAEVLKQQLLKAVF